MADTDIQFTRVGSWGVITLDRPKALNSLTEDMCVRMDEQLTAWADNDEVRAVLIEGEGDKAFCAGGDIRWLAETAQKDPQRAAEFFRKEYNLNDHIARFSKPYIALIDGICMGGGVGVSAMADRRVMTSRTTWAMPECAIGLIPDIGASYFLRQLQGGLAFYLALTGVRMTGGDCVEAGLATHCVDAEKLGDIRTSLLADTLSGDVLKTIDTILAPHNLAPGGHYQDHRPDIDQHFTEVKTVEELISSLEKGGSFGGHAIEHDLLN
ncbi:MAG: enoyl-CoA hydratase/isomerase family protein, partial [Pseudomonadota bacterium]